MCQKDIQFPWISTCAKLIPPKADIARPTIVDRHLTQPDPPKADIARPTIVDRHLTQPDPPKADIARPTIVDRHLTQPDQDKTELFPDADTEFIPAMADIEEPVPLEQNIDQPRQARTPLVAPQPQSYAIGGTSLVMERSPQKDLDQEEEEVDKPGLMQRICIKLGLIEGDDQVKKDLQESMEQTQEQRMDDVNDQYKDYMERQKQRMRDYNLRK